MTLDWLVLSAALLSGLLGGVHCAAMCGAIATSLSFGQKAASPATQWLHALRHEPAVAALEAAVAKEKHDVAKGAMLDALQALGRPVERYLDRDKLAAEARKALSKDSPKDLAWFPWSALPAVR